MCKSIAMLNEREMRTFMPRIGDYACYEVPVTWKKNTSGIKNNFKTRLLDEQPLHFKSFTDCI